MKTTKKGFTLIELIVVIAIIGVLAAILVPSMLGYVKKSKIQAANTAASSVYKAVNSALTELDEEDKDLSALNGDLTKSKTGTSFAAPTTAEGDSSTTTSNAATAGDLYDYALPYFEDLAKTECGISIVNGACKATAAKSGSYYGTYPKIYTAKNYDSTTYNPSSITAALGHAKTKAGVTTSTTKKD